MTGPGRLPIIGGRPEATNTARHLEEVQQMKVFVAGSTGATGRLLVQELLKRGHTVRTVVRSRERLLNAIGDHAPAQLEVTEASLLELNDEQLRELVAGCDAITCCLGHNLTFRGLFGPPYRLVTEATRRLCKAAASQQRLEPVKFVLMNTAGNRNRELNEQVSFAHRCVVGAIRLLVPPHSDNEQASEVLRKQFGLNQQNLEWVVVRPDSLITEERSTDYTLHPSPTRDAIFNAGTTSRNNVAHFMADLVDSGELWQQWRGQMPVIYNKTADA